MPQCQGITRDEQQCRRDATAGRRFCFQHDHSSLERSSLEEPEEPNRRCTDDVDPISLVPLGEDGVEIIRIEGAPLASGLPGPLHCFNADSLAIYIRRNRFGYPIITNPLTREPIPIVQLDAIMDRLGIERPPPRARRLVIPQERVHIPIRPEDQLVYNRLHDQFLADVINQPGLTPNNLHGLELMLTGFDGQFSIGGEASLLAIENIRSMIHIILDARQQRI